MVWCVVWRVAWCVVRWRLPLQAKGWNLQRCKDACKLTRIDHVSFFFGFFRIGIMLFFLSFLLSFFFLFFWFLSFFFILFVWCFLKIDALDTIYACDLQTNLCKNADSKWYIYIYIYFFWNCHEQIMGTSNLYLKSCK